jgi:subtilisin family serine protease
MSGSAFPGPGPGPEGSHGLFVAGLIRAIAPDAQIYLYRALNESGSSSTFQLAVQILRFISFVCNSPVEGSNKAVINLSLGYTPHGDEMPDEAIFEIRILTAILAHAYRNDFVIAGAACNYSDRYDPSVGALPTDFPARMSYIISVGASNAKKKHACYTHMAEVHAPGADGMDPLAVPPAPAASPGMSIPSGVTPRDRCLPHNFACMSGDCNFGLMSWIVRPGTGNVDYGYWSGTSFATPLVSGLAALLLEKGVAPAQVEQCIIDSTSDTGILGDPLRIIDISHILDADC